MAFRQKSGKMGNIPNAAGENKGVVHERLNISINGNVILTCNLSGNEKIIEEINGRLKGSDGLMI
jgi:hypothetical protein